MSDLVSQDGKLVVDALAITDFASYDSFDLLYSSSSISVRQMQRLYYRTTCSDKLATSRNCNAIVHYQLH